MTRFFEFLLFAGATFLCIPSTIAQDYPLWLSTTSADYNEYPTSIASIPGATATVGFHEDAFIIHDLKYNPFHAVACQVCGTHENIFVSLREESSGNTWTANVYTTVEFNNRADVQSVPQVELSSKGDVYVSFTFEGNATVVDANGNTIALVPAISGGYDFAIVKFDSKGEYIWHVAEGSHSNDYATDLHFNEETSRLAVAGYTQGSGLSLVLSGGCGSVFPLTASSLPGFPAYGNAFVVVYEDNGSQYVPLWANGVDAHTYSNDVVIDDNGFVYLSGFVDESSTLAGLPTGYLYRDNSQVNQYFLMQFDDTGKSQWAELYGSRYNELTIAPELRNSSLAINPESSELYFAINNTGSPGGWFRYFGTYVNKINPTNGAILSGGLIGTPYKSNSSSFPNATYGVPTYNPNIEVDEQDHVFLSGNFSLSTGSQSDIGMALDECLIGNTYVDPSVMYAMAGAGHTEGTGWYQAVIDMNGFSLLEENLNVTYVPQKVSESYKQVPVYGTSESVQYDAHFYTALAFNEGSIELDLSVNVGVVNAYQNTGNPQFDGLIVRTDASNGHYKRSSNAIAQDGAQRALQYPTSNAWTLSPNPVKAGQSLLWKSESQQVVDQIRLVDLTGRVLRTWTQPQATAQGFQLSLGDLIPGTYLLEAQGAAVEQSTLIVVQ